MDGLAIFSRRILPTFSYTFADDHDRPLDTGECCVGYSKDEFGNCIEDIVRHTFPTFAVPRFVAAMSALLVVWILVGVFSMLIAYMTTSQRCKNAALRLTTKSGKDFQRNLLLEDIVASRPQSVSI